MTSITIFNICRRVVECVSGVYHSLSSVTEDVCGAMYVWHDRLEAVYVCFAKPNLNQAFDTCHAREGGREGKRDTHREIGGGRLSARRGSRLWRAGFWKGYLPTLAKPPVECKSVSSQSPASASETSCKRTFTGKPRKLGSITRSGGPQLQNRQVCNATPITSGVPRAQGRRSADAADL